MARDDYRHQNPANKRKSNASVVISNFRSKTSELKSSLYISKPRFARKGKQEK